MDWRRSCTLCVVAVMACCSNCTSYIESVLRVHINVGCSISRSRVIFPPDDVKDSLSYWIYNSWREVMTVCPYMPIHIHDGVDGPILWDWRSQCITALLAVCQSRLVGQFLQGYNCHSGGCLCIDIRCTWRVRYGFQAFHWYKCWLASYN